MQRLIKEDEYRNLIDGIIKINKSGRKYVKEDPGNKIKGVGVLKSVWNNPDCILLHLRESPCLREVESSTITNRKRTAASLERIQDPKSRCAECQGIVSSLQKGSTRNVGPGWRSKKKYVSYVRNGTN